MNKSLPGVDCSPRVLFVASEVFPLAKTGGLADVAAALPAALSRLGADVRIMLPAYPQALDLACDLNLVDTYDVPEGRLWMGRMPHSDIPVILFDAPALFRRLGNPYQDVSGQDWPDNDRRFAAFSRAAARVALGETSLDWRPEIVHANDWHTGLVPAFVRYSGGAMPKTVFTIHNLAFQGNFPLSTFSGLGLPGEVLSPNGIEFFNQVSFIKAGIRYGDRVTTVSPTYAREILTPEYGRGLDGLLRARAADLVGILNGVDYSIWDPAHDTELARRYDANDLTGKDDCKEALRSEMGLAHDDNVPLVAYVNRLTYQKMADVVLEVLPRLAASGVQIVVHGQGNRAFEERFLSAARSYPANIAVRIGYNEAQAHRIIGGCDLSLTPARFEPCGLTTMYAMRYGALPVTRAVGGLADTVEDAGVVAPEPLTGSGFTFGAATANDMEKCLVRATSWYRDKSDWKQLQHRAMLRDFSWEQSARRYLETYRGILGEHAPERRNHNRSEEMTLPPALCGTVSK